MTIPAIYPPDKAFESSGAGSALFVGARMLFVLVKYIIALSIALISFERAKANESSAPTASYSRRLVARIN